MKYFIIFAAVLSGCATHSKCPQWKDTHSVYSDDGSCTIRTRRVTVGTESPTPATLRNSNNYDSDVTWEPAKYENGKLVTGHFLVTPKPKGVSDAK